jgi:chromosome segregation ATPase
MTLEERIERTEANLDRLATVVGTLAGTVVAHDSQIGALIQITEKLNGAIDKLNATVDKLNVAIDKQGKEIADMARQWQAYINTLPRQ